MSEHEGEHYLTLDSAGILELWDGAKPQMTAEGGWVGDGSGRLVAAKPLVDLFRPLADPTKPVRIRLKLQAERIGE